MNKTQKREIVAVNKLFLDLGFCFYKGCRELVTLNLRGGHGSSGGNG